MENILVYILIALLAIFLVLICLASIVIIRFPIVEFIEWYRRKKMIDEIDKWDDDELATHIELDIPASEYREFETLINKLRWKNRKL